MESIKDSLVLARTIIKETANVPTSRPSRPQQRCTVSRLVSFFESKGKQQSSAPSKDMIDSKAAGPQPELARPSQPSLRKRISTGLKTLGVAAKDALTSAVKSLKPQPSLQAARAARARTAEHPDQALERVLLEMHRDWKVACKLRNKALDKEEALRAHMNENQGWQQGSLLEQDSTGGLCHVALTIAAQGGAQKRQKSVRGWGGQVAGVAVF